MNNRFTPQERGIIVSYVVLAQREFRRRFPGHPTLTGQTLRRLATRLEENGTTRDIPKASRPRSNRSAENIAVAAHDVEEHGPNDDCGWRDMITELFSSSIR